VTTNPAAWRYGSPGESPRDELSGEDVEMLCDGLEFLASDHEADATRLAFSDPGEERNALGRSFEARDQAARCRALAARLRGEWS
jgi:hypothetical protein